MVLGSDGPFPSASTAHMYTIRQASTRHWYYNLSLNTRLRLLLNGRAQTEPWQCQLQKRTVFLFTLPPSGQRCRTNRDHKHSARFISRDYKAFTCRIVGQKVQRVPVLPKVGWQGRQSMSVCWQPSPSPTHQHKGHKIKFHLSLRQKVF